LIKDKNALLLHNNMVVAIICGKDYNKLLRVIDMDNVYVLQLFISKVTGNLKHGNENKNA